MKKRIFASLSLVGTVITLVTALLTLSAFYQLFTAQAREQLRTEAELLSRAINQDEAGSETYLEALAGGHEAVWILPEDRNMPERHKMNETSRHVDIVRWSV